MLEEGEGEGRAGNVLNLYVLMGTRDVTIFVCNQVGVHGAEITGCLPQPCEAKASCVVSSQAPFPCAQSMGRTTVRSLFQCKGVLL